MTTELFVADHQMAEAISKFLLRNRILNHIEPRTIEESVIMVDEDDRDKAFSLIHANMEDILAIHRRNIAKHAPFDADMNTPTDSSHRVNQYAPGDEPRGAMRLGHLAMSMPSTATSLLFVALAVGVLLPVTPVLPMAYAVGTMVSFAVLWAGMTLTSRNH